MVGETPLPEVSVIAPARDEAGCVVEFVERLSAVLDRIVASQEIILVDDGSTDGTRELVLRKAETAPALRVIQPESGRGQSAAIDAGLRMCRGRVVVVMDCDLQDVPEEVPMLLEKLQTGYDLVVGCRTNRSADSLLVRRLPSRVANVLIRLLTGCPVHDVGGMTAMRGEVARALRLADGEHRFLPVLVHLRGGRVGEVSVSRPARGSGRSHYGLGRVCAVTRDLCRLGKARLLTAVAVSAMLLLSAALNLFGNTFPVGFHIDTPKKVMFIQSMTQDFLHPILMLQIARAANAFAGFTDAQDVAVLGRCTTAAAGVLLTLGIYLLARRAMKPLVALLTGLAAAVCPTLVVHSHYLKEDILFTACMVWTLLFYLRFLERPTFVRAVVLGIFTGLTGSASYKAALLIPMLLLFPLLPRCRAARAVIHREQSRGRLTGDVLEATGVGSRWKIYLWGLAAIAIAADVFAVVNYPLFDDPETFLNGVAYESEHAVKGHAGVVIYPGPQWYQYHWRFSIVPGMTLLAALAGLLGLVVAAFGGVRRWLVSDDGSQKFDVASVDVALTDGGEQRIGEAWSRDVDVSWGVRRSNMASAAKAAVQDRLLVIFTLSYYFIVECSPTKPPPGDCRYAIPAVVGLVYFGGWLVNRLWHGRSLTWRLSAFATGAVLIGPPLVDSALLDWHMTRDTRHRAADYVTTLNGNVAFQRYSSPEHIYGGRYFTVDDLLASDADYVAVSSFHYDHYDFIRDLPGQPDEATRQTAEFDRLFTFPYVEIRPAHRSFAFTNPTIRVVDIREGTEHR